MGYLQALGWAQSADLMGLETAIYGHLTSNMYPPLGGALIVALPAVLAVASGDNDVILCTLSDGIERSAGRIVDDLHLEPFVEYVKAHPEVNSWADGDDIGGYSR